tara:strand:+ start:135 stop:683 length:549 start_codon:yes stop_codon:yes gene_type:complete
MIKKDKKNKQHNIVAVGALYFSAILPAIKLPIGTTIIAIEFSEETRPLNMSGTSEARLDLIIVRVLMIPKLTKKAAGKDTNSDLEFAKISIAIQAIVQYEINSIFFWKRLFHNDNPKFPRTPPVPRAAKSNPKPKEFVFNSSAANTGSKPCTAGVTNKYIQVLEITIACISGDFFRKIYSSL